MIYVASAILLGLTAWSIIDARRANDRLTSLRSNCFLTNEQGHRVRYANASQVVRDKAETN